MFRPGPSGVLTLCTAYDCTVSDGGVTARERELLDGLLRYAAALDELADMFRATAGERPAALAYAYADVASGIRAQVRRFVLVTEHLAERETADHPRQGGRPRDAA